MAPWLTLAQMVIEFLHRLLEAPPPPRKDP